LTRLYRHYISLFSCIDDEDLLQASGMLVAVCHRDALDKHSRATFLLGVEKVETDGYHRHIIQVDLDGKQVFGDVVDNS
jgi:hypothetical protein